MKRAAKIAAASQAEIIRSHAMTPDEIAAEVRAAWERGTDPEATAATVAARGRAPLKAKGPGCARPIIVVGADGKPKKIVPSSQLLQALLEKEGVEGATVEAKRVRVVRCIKCRSPRAVGRAGSLPMYCLLCLKKSKQESTRRAQKKHIAKLKAAYPDRVREEAARGARERLERDPNVRLKHRRYQAKYRAEHGDKIKAQRRAYYIAHRDEAKARCAKSRAAKKAAK